MEIGNVIKSISEENNEEIVPNVNKINVVRIVKVNIFWVIIQGIYKNVRQVFEEVMDVVVIQKDIIKIDFRIVINSI